MPLAALRCSRLLLGQTRELEGIVGSRSPRSILCELPGPSFLWLLRPGLSLGPRALSCELERFRPEAGAPVRCTPGRIELDGRALSLDGAEPWEPRWSPTPPRAVRSMPQPPRSLAPELVQALAGRGTEDAPALVASLLGLGSGSTPAGDDLLLGLRAAWRLRRAAGDPVPPLAALDAELRACARGGTGPIAAEMLLDALEDLFPEAIHGVLEALAGVGALTPALARLRELGASSGLAMEWGIWLGLQTGRPGELSAGA